MIETNFPIQQATSSAEDRYRAARQEHWDATFRSGNGFVGGRYYRHRLKEVYGFVCSPRLDILEIGCGGGDLLASLHPKRGVGVDFSPAALEVARKNHPELEFMEADAHSLALDETFDVVILSDLINDLWDVQMVLERAQQLLKPDGILVCNFFSRVWEAPLVIAQKLGLARPNLHQNWLTPVDVANLLNLTNFEVVRQWREILWPVGTPLVAPFFNRFLAKLWPLRGLSLSNFVVARPLKAPDREFSVSVVVAARNEEGNIDQIFARVPQMGLGTELVFVEGHSRDDTYGAIERYIAAHPEINCHLYRQTGVGKGDAVRLGFEKATGDILMILDADLTVPPEDLPRFYDAIRSNKGQYINGVRLIYPMEEEAMRFANFLGNKFFSLAFSWLIGQPIKDTLCGTKVLHRDHYARIAANRAYFGDFDPFGDFDLILGAAKQNLKMIDIPIRYRQRTYGSTNIERWKHGWLLLKMAAFAARRLKFI